MIRKVEDQPAPLTERQEKILGFIRAKIADEQRPPTIREIGARFAIGSPNGVMCHLRALRKKGYLDKPPRSSSRSIRVSDAARGVPFVGDVPAGPLSETFAQADRIDLGDLLPDADPGATFVLLVRGDSMIDDHIADGDLVVVRRAEAAATGAIVVAQTADGQATLKRWYPEPEKGRVRLQPSNAAMAPIYATDARVVGVVVGLWRPVG